MAQSPRWKDLTIGIVSAAAILLGAALVLIYGRVGGLHGKTFSVYVTSDAARGVIRGTEVWLDGQKVGLVRNVSFQSPSVSPRERVVMSLTVLDDARPRIRRDTRVDIRSGGTLLGDQVVYLSSGTTRVSGVNNGDTIHAGNQMDLESIASDVTGATGELPGIVENVKLLTAQLRSAQSTIGAFGLDGGGPQMRQATEKASRIMSRLSSSKGTAGLVMSHSDLLMARASHAMAQADSIRALLSSNQHSLGRFRRDSSIVRAIQNVQAELQHVEQLASEPTGTIGRFRADSAVTYNINRDMAALDSLMADIKKHPLRYIAF
jgi:phospholipid/cholesterol/gamma-HCH transport system substrate-binding protein